MKVDEVKEEEIPANLTKSLTFENLTGENPLAVKARSMSLDAAEKTSPENEERLLQQE